MANTVGENLQTKAIQAFNQRPSDNEPSEVFIAELTKLQESLNDVTAEDLNLEDAVKSIPKSSRVIVTFVDIFENPNPLISIMVVIMTPGSRIPLHDHPNMYGMIKVLAGQIQVKSYTLLDQPVVELNDPNNPQSMVMAGLRMPEKILSKNSPPIALSPEIRNLHQIEFICGEGEENYAAFLDILSPPYPDEDSCHFFKVEENVQMTKGSPDHRQCRLVQIECPKDYFTEILKLDV